MILTIDTEKPEDVARGLFILKTLTKTSGVAKPSPGVVTNSVHAVKDAVEAMAEVLRLRQDITSPVLVSVLYEKTYGAKSWSSLPAGARQQLGRDFGAYVIRSSDLYSSGRNGMHQALYVRSK